MEKMKEDKEKKMSSEETMSRLAKITKSMNVDPFRARGKFCPSVFSKSSISREERRKRTKAKKAIKKMNRRK